MGFDARGWVSVVELIVFLPSLIVSFIICSRHGFTRSSGWLYTLILCLVRIVGAVCQLLTYHDHSSGLLKTTVIVDSIGLSPLLLATLGMLSRFVDWINARSQGIFSVKHFRIIQLLITLGLILSIAGGTSGNTNSNGTVTVSTTSKVGIILYIVAYCGLCLVLLLSMSSIRVVPTLERRIALGVIVVLPFILVRLAYSALAVFVHNHLFNPVNGSVAVFVAMGVVEEFIVVFIYLLLGFSLEKLQPGQQGQIVSRPWKEPKAERRQNRGNDQRRTRSVSPRPPEQVRY